MSLQSAYDELPYGSSAVLEMHPNRMATVARLFGLAPAPVRTCRVLEIGCAEGGNTIPLAVALPEARVVGIDLSERQIAIGRERVSALGLTNVELIRGDLADLAGIEALAGRAERKAELGTFDYVCAHGVYSWIEPGFQEKLLRACHDLLAPDGVAYVSYNTHPGWGFQLVLREMALFRARHESGAARKVAAVRRLLGSVAAKAEGSGGGYRALLAEKWADLATYPDAYFFHDHLEEENHPCWFHELARKAEDVGLTYVADALLDAPPGLAAVSRMAKGPGGTAAGRVERGQYADFLGDRSFRQSLLCRSERTPLEEPDLSILDRLHVVSLVEKPATPVDPGPDAKLALVSLRGDPIETTDPVVKACLAHLWERSPEAVPFAGLARCVAAAGSGPSEEDLRRLRRSLLDAYAGRFVDLLEYVPAFASRPGARPVASPLARLQAGSRGSHVSSLLHRNLELDDISLLVLARLDGTRDLEALARETAEAVAAEGLTRDAEGNAVRDLASVRRFVDRAMGPILEGLAQGAFLTA